MLPLVIHRLVAARVGWLCGSLALFCLAADPTPSRTTLRQAFADDFLIGAALGPAVIRGWNPKAGELAASQFSSVTPENEMKWQSLQPDPGRFDFSGADAYAEFARQHDMKLIGHALVWHSQTPDWVFQGDGGRPATREELLHRMREHIHAVVGRYRGKILGWDVVNEALSDHGEDPLRKSPWRDIIGGDFIDHAFRFAREADPDAELYYNDYGLEDPRKRAHCIRLIQGLIDRGVPINGVGTQSHFHLNGPPVEEVERTLAALAGLRLKVMVTELDVDVLPTPGNPGIADISRREDATPSSNPYPSGLPDEIQQQLARRYADLFKVYLQHRKSITRVTFWGLDDGNTWLNHFPIPRRTNHPLLFDRNLMPKPAFSKVIEIAAENR